MKSILTIIFLFLGSFIFGQTCDTIDGEPINCIDSGGLRQGFWELTKTKLVPDPSRCDVILRDKKYVYAKGMYQDNVKIHTWEYYSNRDLDSLERKITYFPDGSFTINDLLQQFKLTLNHDTSIITGKVNCYSDTFNLECSFDSCFINLANGQKVVGFELFDINQLTFEIYKLQIGEYDREIYKITHANSR